MSRWLRNLGERMTDGTAPGRGIVIHRQRRPRGSKSKMTRLAARARMHAYCLVVVALLAIVATAQGQVGQNTLVSVTEPGDTTAGNVQSGTPFASLRPHISDDGNIVIWQGLSSNITSATDRNCSVRSLASPCGEPGSDIYVRNMSTTTTRLVSHKSGDITTTGQEQAEFPVITPDGNFTTYRGIAVQSPLEITTETVNDLGIEVFRGNLSVDPATNRLVTIKTTGNTSSTAFFGGDNPVITPDGRYVVFQDDATDLGNVAITNPEGSDQIYRADMNSTPATFTLVSGTNATTACDDGDPNQALSFAVGARVSANGNRIVFQSPCSNLVPNYTRNKTLNGLAVDVYIRDVLAGTTKLVSKAANAAPGTNPAGNGGSFNADITPDGRFVIFTSKATNLVTGLTDTNKDAPGDPAGSGSDVFLYDVANDSVSLVSKNNAGTGTGNDTSSIPTLRNRPRRYISLDNRFITFTSQATDLAGPGVDTSSGTTGIDVYIRDLLTGVTESSRNRLVSATPGAINGNGISFEPFMSGNGRFVAFSSQATNLVTGFVDGNAGSDSDIFLRHVPKNSTLLISHADGSTTTSGNGFSQTPVLTPDAKFIVFESKAGNLAPSPFVDTNSAGDIYRQQLAGALPQVANIVAATSGGDVQLTPTPGAKVLSGSANVSQLKVVYDWDVRFAPSDPTDPTNTDAGKYADTVNNYRLVSAGPNGAFDTALGSTPCTAYA